MRKTADPRQRHAALAYLAGLCFTAAWTIVVAYLLPPWAGSSVVRLAGFLAGATAAFWAGQRLARARLRDLSDHPKR